MDRDLRLAAFGAVLFVFGLALGELGDAPPGAPCAEGDEGADCERVPASEGLLFIGRTLLVAGFVMALVAGVRGAIRAWRGRPPA